MKRVSPLEVIESLVAGHVGKGLPLVDVRSEGEFFDGHFEGAVNAPILNDSERAAVGTAYKKQGQSVAVELGHKLVGPHKDARIQNWKQVCQGTSGTTAIVMCWRGGMRSQITQTWLHEVGVSVSIVEGGYKAIRGELLAVFDEFSPLVVLSGLTGSGKTELLQKLDAPKVDLEGLALHRGSSFGGFLGRPQPRQATFENSLAIEFLKDRGQKRVVEDESARVGAVSLPPLLKQKMTESPVVILATPLENRVHHIFLEYVLAPLKAGVSQETVFEKLSENLKVLERRLGGLATMNLVKELTLAFEGDPTEEARHTSWISGLLTDYYDKAYQFAFNRQTRPILFEGDESSCLKFLTENLSASPKL